MENYDDILIELNALSEEGERFAIYSKDFALSTHGRLYHIPSKRFQKPYITGTTGIWFYYLSADTSIGKTTKEIGMMVLERFNPPTDLNNGKVIYKDGNPANYKLTNLEWGTDDEYHMFPYEQLMYYIKRTETLEKEVRNLQNNLNLYLSPERLNAEFKKPLYTTTEDAIFPDFPLKK